MTDTRRLRELLERATPSLVSGSASHTAIAELLRAGYKWQRPKAKSEPHYEDDAILIAEALPALRALLDRIDTLEAIAPSRVVHVRVVHRK